MANIGQIYYRVYNATSNEYITTAGFENNFFGIDIISKFAGAPKTVSKLGVQAPPGTHFILNNSKEIMIGRTGVYELDENVNITSVQFEQPQLYVKDVEKSNKAISDGKTAMEKAEKDKFDSLQLQGLIGENGEVISPIPDDKMDAYLNICKDYNKAYNDGYDLYMQGILGYYSESSETQDLENIIVDFIYS